MTKKNIPYMFLLLIWVLACGTNSGGSGNDSQTGSSNPVNHGANPVSTSSSSDGFNEQLTMGGRGGPDGDTCPNAPLQQLTVGEMAFVCTASETVKLRDGAGKNYEIIKSLIPGADVKVIGGPECADDWSWWQVETESGYIGWMSEGGDETDYYFLCPSK